jgi:hypothetical protein
MSSLQCTAITLAGTRCSRNSEPDSKFCWQHEVKDYLITDLENIVYSYLSLEELLEQYSDDMKLVDKLVQQYFPELPTLEESVADGNLNTVKYLVEVKSEDIDELIFQPDREEVYELSTEKTILDVAAQYDQVEMLKYFTGIGKDPDITTLNFAIYYHNYNTAKYLLAVDIYNYNDEYKLNKSEKLKEFLDPYKYLMYRRYTFYASEYKKIINDLVDYLITIKIPTNEHLKFIVDNFDYIPNRTIDKVIKNVKDPDKKLLYEIDILNLREDEMEEQEITKEQIRKEEMKEKEIRKK